MSDNTDTEIASDRNMVPALERGLRILGEFGRDARLISAPEFARRLRLPRSTVFRLLSTLESLGLVERKGNEYRLGLAVLRLGFEYIASLELTEIGQPLLQRLCDEISYPTNLVIRDGRWSVYVAKVSPPHPWASSVRVGTRLPAHATVLGRVLLGDLTLPQLRALYPEEHLEAVTADTPATVLELFDLVQADRERGYVVANGFFEPALSSIGAPVHDHTGQTVAALGSPIPTGQIDRARTKFVIERVRAAAAELSALLNFQSPSGSNVRSFSKARSG